MTEGEDAEVVLSGTEIQEAADGERQQVLFQHGGFSFLDDAAIQPRLVLADFVAELDVSTPPV